MTDEVEIVNRSRPLKTPLQALYCERFFCRLRGLSFQKHLPPNRGLLLVYPRESRIDAAIHMFWMNFDIGIAWLSSNFRVVDRKMAFRWRTIHLPRYPAKYILEFPLNRFEEFSIDDEIILKSLPRA